MGAMRFRVDNLKEVKAALQALPAMVRADMGDEVREAAELAAAVARQHVPVHTGALKASIGVSKSTGQGSQGKAGSATNPLAWRVYVNSPYAHYVEYGTKYMPARPFLRTGTDAAAYYLKATVKAYASTFQSQFLRQMAGSVALGRR